MEHLAAKQAQLSTKVRLYNTFIVSVGIQCFFMVVKRGRCDSQMKDVLKHSICSANDESLEYTGMTLSPTMQ